MIGIWSWATKEYFVGEENFCVVYRMRSYVSEEGKWCVSVFW